MERGIRRQEIFREETDLLYIYCNIKECNGKIWSKPACILFDDELYSSVIGDIRYKRCLTQ